MEDAPGTAHGISISHLPHEMTRHPLTEEPVIMLPKMEGKGCSKTMMYWSGLSCLSSGDSWGLVWMVRIEEKLDRSGFSKKDLAQSVCLLKYLYSICTL